MGFSKADWESLQVNLDRIRFGSRIQPRPPIHVPGLPDLKKSQRREKRVKPPEEPSYDVTYQRRLW